MDTVPLDYRVKTKENKKIHKKLDLAREIKMMWNMRVMVIQSGADVLRKVSKGSEKKTSGSGNKMKNPDHPDHSIVKIG